MDKFLEYAPLVVTGVGALLVKAIVIGFTVYNTILVQRQKSQLIAHGQAIGDLQTPVTDEKNSESASA